MMQTLLLTTLLTLTSLPLVSPTPVIRSPWGEVSGKRMQGAGGEQVDGYLGIPFALPPTGQRRWEKPVAHPGHEGGEAYDATEFKPGCQQAIPSMLLYGGVSEDCLYLNIFTPAEDEKSGRLRPVMVWIHGGGFIMGDAPLYQPYQLVYKGDVIVVTIQYRVAAFGFLATGDGTLPGNYGLWDQQMALTWVRDNIRAFGGDPGLVTIFGESAGSMSVGLQAITPKSKGLFRRVILQSGSPTIFGDKKWVKDADATFNDFATSFGCQNEDKVKAVECLRAQPAEVIANDPSTSLEKFIEENPFEVAFGPQVDGDFIPRDVAELVADPDYIKRIGLDRVDVLTGFNNNEGALNLFAASVGGKGFESVQSRKYMDLYLTSLDYFTKGRHGKAAEKAVEFFYRGADAFTDKPTDLVKLTQMCSDSLFYAPSIQWMRGLVQAPHTGKRYLYLFDQDFIFNRHTPALRGTHHGDELAVEFESKVFVDAMYFQLQGKKFDTPDIPALADIFQGVVTNFAKTGNPGQGLNLQWPEYATDNEAYVAISGSPEVRQEVFADRMALWLELLPLLTKGEKSCSASGSPGKPKEEL